MLQKLKSKFSYQASRTSENEPQGKIKKYIQINGIDAQMYATLYCDTKKYTAHNIFNIKS